MVIGGTTIVVATGALLITLYTHRPTKPVEVPHIHWPESKEIITLPGTATGGVVYPHIHSPTGVSNLQSVPICITNHPKP